MNMELPLLSLEAPLQPEQSPVKGEQGSLYRTYRSLTFGEVAGQQPVTQTLRNAVRYGKVTHAYLFTGPRGTGKTSTARILARAVNCLQPADGEPCNRCAMCISMLERRSLDLVEIDGASNNSVDDVRELIARVNFRPAEARRKVFIIDEVHMLSIGAFNALLKTLEEPPDHVLFLLATTEVQKVPATITSRCQLFSLKPIATPEMMGRLRYICDRERIVADDTVLSFVARQSTGSLRDALSLLEQIRAYCGDVLQLAEVEAALGLARAGQVANLAEAMAQGDLPAALLAVGEMSDNGLDPRQLARQLAGYWSEALNARARRQPVPEPHVASMQADGITLVLRSLLSVESATRRSDSPRWALELAIAEATLALGKGKPGTTASPRAPEVTTEPRAAPPAPTYMIVESEPATSGLTGDGPMTAMARANGATQKIDPQAAGGDPAAPPTPAAEQVAPPPSMMGAAQAQFGGSQPPEAVAVQAVAPTMSDDEARERWPRVLRWLTEHDKKNIKGYLGGTTAQGIAVDGTALIIGFSASSSSGLMRSQLERPANRAILEQAVRDVYGSQWTVRCATIEGLPPPQSAEDLESDAIYFEQQLKARRRGPEGV